MNQDIENEEDIKLLIDSFYQRVITDSLIGPFFTEVIKLNFDEHIPVMYSFWESILLLNASYKGNPIIKHIALNQKTKLEEKHFDQWLFLWNQTIDEHFIGAMAEKAKEKAVMMKLLMLQKIRRSEHPGFIS